MSPIFFRASSEFREWLLKNHATTSELLVGFHKKGSGKLSINWPESVDEALRFGWIDGIRKRIDAVSYTIHFTPRKPGSIWSSVNIRRAQELIGQGLMEPAGIKALKARTEKKSSIYSYEQRSVELTEPYAQLLKREGRAWNFFQNQPDSYRKVASWWIVSAKKEETRQKRLQKLITYSTQRKRLPEFTSRRPA